MPTPERTCLLSAPPPAWNARREPRRVGDESPLKKRLYDPDGILACGPSVNLLSFAQILTLAVFVRECLRAYRLSIDPQCMIITDDDVKLETNLVKDIGSTGRRASALNGPTDVALAFADYLKRSNENARRFEQLDISTINLIEEIQRVAAAPVSLISTRFDFRSIIDRRAW